MTEIFTAKTVEEAKAMAVKKFGKKGEIRFEIITEGKKGILGIGKVDAKVKATYFAPLTKTEPKKEAVQKPVQKQEVKAPEPPKAVEKPVEAVEKPVEAVEKPVEAVEKPVETVEKPVEAVEKPAEAVEKPAEAVEKPVETVEKSPEETNENELDFSIDDFSLITDESLLHEKVKLARDYITTILKAMNIEPEYSIYQNETGAVINIESDNNGTIIGRRGETLDAMQYLCSIIANKGDKDYFRITINCLGYREKRKETLKQLAKNVARSVIRSGRAKTLEPMNPYERRVIHAAISEIEGVSSRSVGEEPYRKIIISSNNPKASKKKNSSRHDERRGKKTTDRKSPREPKEIKTIDLSTSFEKDYKKPKPEDTIEGGLYGKMEF